MRKPASFRLREDILAALKIAAAAANRSLNNYVETILAKSVHIPNEETKAAIDEAHSGKNAGTINMDNFDSFMKSINDIK